MEAVKQNRLALRYASKEINTIVRGIDIDR
jgi:hypothetical protein